MAQKKTGRTKSTGTTKRKTGSRSASGTRSKKSSARRGNPQPKRREIGAIVCFFLFLFTLLAYFDSDGWFIKFFSSLVKGLFGWGFYFVPPAFLGAAIILVMHKGRPVALRVTCTIAIPVMIGAVYHLFSVGNTYALSFKMFSQFWNLGKELRCGGAFSGSLSTLFMYLFSKAGAAAIFIFLTIICFFVALKVSPAGIAEKYRQREKLEYEYIPEPEPKHERREREHRKNIFNPKTKDAIDIPLDKEDEEQTSDRKEVPEILKGDKKVLFNSKPRVTTPDQYLSGSNSAEQRPAVQDPASELYNASFDDDVELDSFDGGKEKIADKQREFSAGHAVPGEKSSATVPDIFDTISDIPDEFEVSDNKEYQFPPLSLLSDKKGGNGDSDGDIAVNKDRLETALRSFGVNASISNIVKGPSVTRFEMELEAGVKLSRITNLADDIALSLGASGVRIAAIPNKISTVGIEVPNKKVGSVYLREIIDSPEFRNAKSKLTFAIGKNIAGDAVVGNISKLPHMLVAGTTGSGKSVCLNSLILSILYKAKPDEVKFIMIDPKMVEFKIYNGIPHLLSPVVTEAKKASGALQWAVTEMMKRYRLFSEVDARDIESYNKIMKNSEDGSVIPSIVVIIDELADLMMIAAKEVEESICRIAQMGRAAGVHLVIATQSPRADVITGLMKANIPSRIALKVSSSLESRIILDAGGNADKLIGNGDMLFAPTGTTKPMRIQGTWVSDEERESIIKFIKSQGQEVEYDESVIDQMNKACEDKKSAEKEDAASGDDYDPLFAQAVDVILDSSQASVSMLQRRLKLGYARAARLVDQMEERGIVGPFEGSKPRQVLISKQQWQEMQLINGTAPLEKPDTREENPHVMSSADDLFDE